MNPADIRAFVRRDRAPVEEEKRAYLAEAYRERGPEETLLAAARMYEYARAVRPDFPTEEDLAEDLAHQVAFKKQLMAIARARCPVWSMSVAESDPQGVAAFLGACATAFSDLGVRWYLFGAQAAFFYGASRLTVDVDITVALERCSATELSAALLRHGIRLRVEDEAFVARTRVLPVVHTASRVVGDIVLAGPGLEEGFLERAIVRDVLGVRVPVAAAEDLVVMKILAGRPKDIEDVKAIVAAQGGKLNVAEIRETLQIVEEALGQSDLLPVFEKVLATARPRRRRSKR